MFGKTDPKLQGYIDKLGELVGDEAKAAIEAKINRRPWKWVATAALVGVIAGFVVGFLIG